MQFAPSPSLFFTKYFFWGQNTVFSLSEYCFWFLKVGISGVVHDTLWILDPLCMKTKETFPLLARIDGELVFIIVDVFCGNISQHHCQVVEVLISGSNITSCGSLSGDILSRYTGGVLNASRAFGVIHNFTPLLKKHFFSDQDCH